MARAAAESKAELLRNKLREVAERSKARGNTLASVVSAVRRVADAKQQLSAAEAELQQVLQEAEAFLQVRPPSHSVVRLWSHLSGVQAKPCRDRMHAAYGGHVSSCGWMHAVPLVQWAMHACWSSTTYVPSCVRLAAWTSMPAGGGCSCTRTGPSCRPGLRAAAPAPARISSRAGCSSSSQRPRRTHGHGSRSGRRR